MNWIWRWLTQRAKTSEPADPGDSRWSCCGALRTLSRGRLCVCRKGDWRSEYLFDVVKDGRTQQVRILLPEQFVSAWEKSLGKRMTEPMRQTLAQQTLARLAKGKSLPNEVVIDEATVRAVQP